mgnify:FL=1
MSEQLSELPDACLLPAGWTLAILRNSCDDTAESIQLVAEVSHQECVLVRISKACIPSDSHRTEDELRAKALAWIGLHLRKSA